MSFYSDWVQPADVDVVTVRSVLVVTEFGTPGSGSVPYGIFPDAAPTEVHVDAFAASDDLRWQTAAVRLAAGDLDADPVSPAPPEGATVDYESPQGLLLAASISGQVIVTADPQLPDPPVVEVWEALLADIDPGFTLGFTTGPVNTVAGNPVWTHTGQGTFAFTTPAQAFPAVEQVVGWRIGEIHGLAQTAPAETADAGGTYYVTVEGGATAAVDLAYSYRPPRYRWAYAELPGLPVHRLVARGLPPTGLVARQPKWW